MEKGGALMHTHFQMVVKRNFSSLPVLNKNIKVCLGWDERLPTGHVLSCKRLKDERLHTFLGDGWVLHEEEHFEFVHHN